jgi:hypothetical protein
MVLGWKTLYCRLRKIVSSPSMSCLCLARRLTESSSHSGGLDTSAILKWLQTANNREGANLFLGGTHSKRERRPF